MSFLETYLFFFQSNFNFELKRWLPVMVKVMNETRCIQIDELGELNSIRFIKCIYTHIKDVSLLSLF